MGPVCSSWILNLLYAQPSRVVLGWSSVLFSQPFSSDTDLLLTLVLPILHCVPGISILHGYCLSFRQNGLENRDAADCQRHTHSPCGEKGIFCNWGSTVRWKFLIAPELFNSVFITIQSKQKLLWTQHVRKSLLLLEPYP